MDGLIFLLNSPHGSKFAKFGKNYNFKLLQLL